VVGQGTVPGATFRAAFAINERGEIAGLSGGRATLF